MKPVKVAVLGSGNLAYHFVPSLLKLDDLFISCLHSRNKVKGLSLCKTNKIAFANSLASIPADVSVVLLMTSDDSIKPLTTALVEHLSPEVTIVHFSGACSLDEIDPYFLEVANVWPLQSISELDDSLVLSDVPLFISASSSQTLAKISSIFESVSERVSQVDQATKLTLHVAAIFANNFTNHLFHLTQEFLLDKNLEFEVVKPLIRQTLEKVMSNDPKDVQTGPAIRGDEVTISKHLALLESKPELKEIYTTLTKSIKKTQ